MKIGFMGTPDFAAFVLDKLSKKHELVWVLSQPSKKRGRGKKLSYSPVIQYAVDNELKYFEVDKITDSLLEELNKLDRPDVIVVVAYGVIIPEWFIQEYDNKLLNIHYSLLPKYRGAAPVARAIMDGETKTGVSVMQIVKALDAGDIVIQKSIPIQDDDTTETLTWRLTKLGTELLDIILDDYVHKRIQLKEQEHSMATYAKKLSKEEARIDWSDSAVNIVNKVRALNPWPLASTSFNGTEIKILKVKLRTDFKAKTSFVAGQIIELNKQHLSVLTGDAVVDIVELKPQSRSKQTFKDFVNGYKPALGDLFK